MHAPQEAERLQGTPRQDNRAPAVLRLRAAVHQGDRRRGVAHEAAPVVQTGEEVGGDRLARLQLHRHLLRAPIQQQIHLVPREAAESRQK